jgi:hypothetical protein
MIGFLLSHVLSSNRSTTVLSGKISVTPLSLIDFTARPEPTTLSANLIGTWVETRKDLSIRICLKDNFDKGLKGVGFSQAKARSIGRGERRGFFESRRFLD